MSTKKVLGICTLLLLVVFSMGCGRRVGPSPSSKASLWVCEDPYFEMSYVSGSQVSYIEWEGEKYEVFVGMAMTANSFTVYLLPDDGVLRPENILLHGTWKYKGENMVVKIDTDRIFGWVYKKLVFVPQK